MTKSFHSKLFQHVLSAEILSEWKIGSILPYLGRNIWIIARDKVISKCSLTFSHYTRPHLEYYDGYVYVKNKLDSQIYSLFYKFNVCFIKLENLVYQNNPEYMQCCRAIIYAKYNTQSTESYKADVSKYISFSFNSLIEISRSIHRTCYVQIHSVV